MRQRGREAVAAALGQTRPLVDVLWAKEFDAAALTTPERRAQFDRRLDELAASIADKTVQHYYGRELRRRLREQFGGFTPWQNRAGGAGQGQTRPAGGKFASAQTAGRSFAGGFTGSKRQPFAPAAQGATAALADSALLRPAALALPRREALILQTILNHPWLLDDCAEDIAAIHFEAIPLHQLRDRILSVHSEHFPLDKEGLHNQLNKLGQDGLLAQVEHAITHNSDWNTQPRTSREDVMIGWRHMLALHRKAVELKRELESAEHAFASEQSEENYLRLRDLREQVLSADGVQAAVEGYGKSVSG